MRSWELSSPVIYMHKSIMETVLVQLMMNYVIGFKVRNICTFLQHLSHWVMLQSLAEWSACEHCLSRRPSEVLWSVHEYASPTQPHLLIPKVWKYLHFQAGPSAHLPHLVCSRCVVHAVLQLLVYCLNQNQSFLH